MIRHCKYRIASIDFSTNRHSHSQRVSDSSGNTFAHKDFLPRHSVPPPQALHVAMHEGDKEQKIVADSATPLRSIGGTP